MMSPSHPPTAPAPRAAVTPAPQVGVPSFAGYANPVAPSVRQYLLLTARYLMRTEVHTYAFSVAANAILSFFPFVVLLLTLIRRVFRSPAMYEVVLQLVRDNLPTGQEFVIRNLRALAGGQRAEVFSLGMLLITSTGVFLPLEVALNQVWGFRRNRSYVGNQIIALLLAFASGSLALISVALTATNQRWLQFLLGGGLVSRTLTFGVMKTTAILASIAIFFLIYYVLPHGKVPAKAVLPAAIVAGLLWEVAKYAYVMALPWLNFQEIYGPFSISVTLMFWAFLSGLLLLGGAYLSAAGRVAAKPESAN